MMAPVLSKLAFVALAPLALASKFIIHNECQFPVSYSPVTQYSTPAAQRLPEYYEDDIQWTENGGMAFKLAKNDDWSHIFQLEYRVDTQLWYDGSNVNENHELDDVLTNDPWSIDQSLWPLTMHGFRMKPSMCPEKEVECATDSRQCEYVYEKPDDDTRKKCMWSCDVASDWEVWLCHDTQNWHGDAASNTTSSQSTPSIVPASTIPSSTSSQSTPYVAPASTISSFTETTSPTHMPWSSQAAIFGGHHGPRAGN